MADAEIVTDRLILRPLDDADLPEMTAILGDAVTMAFWPRPLTAEEAAAWVARSARSWEERGYGRWAVRRRDDPRLIGDCGLIDHDVAGERVIDLGYVLSHGHWRRGYATEAVRAVADWAFASRRLATLHANVPVDHVASRRVAEKLGMGFCRTFRNPRNRDRETILYVLDEAMHAAARLGG